MTKIDFAFGAKNRLNMACQVVYKNYQASQPILIYCSDPKRLEALNKKLWQVQPESFMPHPMVNSEQASNQLVLMCSENPAQAISQFSRKPWLLNMDLLCPPGSNAFDRILEIVSNHEEDKKAARARWLEYKDQGFDLKAHDASTAASNI